MSGKKMSYSKNVKEKMSNYKNVMLKNVILAKMPSEKYHMAKMSC